MGRGQYGPWHVGDGRDYAREAYAEILDALNYLAAELVRRQRADSAEPTPKTQEVAR